MHPIRDNSTDGEVSSPPSVKVDNNDEWNEDTSCQHPLTVCVAGRTLQINSTKVSLALLDQTSEPTDSKAPNHNRFAALDSPSQKSTDFVKSKWVVPPKSEKELREEEAA